MGNTSQPEGGVLLGVLVLGYERFGDFLKTTVLYRVCFLHIYLHLGYRSFSKPQFCPKHHTLWGVKRRVLPFKLRALMFMNSVGTEVLAIGLLLV